MLLAGGASWVSWLSSGVEARPAPVLLLMLSETASGDWSSVCDGELTAISLSTFRLAHSRWP